jgi:hypothetical protein
MKIYLVLVLLVISQLSIAQLAEKLAPATDTVLKMFREAGMNPRQHELTAIETQKVMAALDKLPPLHKKVLKERLRHISFLDSMPNTALTSIVNNGDAVPAFDLTIRAAIIGQSVTEWINEKEQSYYIKDSSGYSVSIEAGKLDAIFYVLLHETTHIVDGSIRKDKEAFVNDMTNGVWTDRITIATPYDFPVIDSLYFRKSGRKIPIAQCLPLYKAFAKTPFASLYSTSSWSEDLAEFVTVSHFTQQLKQPFRITVKKNNAVVFAYEPMKNELVRKRLVNLKPIYRG